MSSASSGYNSLPRSLKSKAKSQTGSQSSPKTSPRHMPKNSIKVELSSNPAGGVISDTKVDTHMTASINDPSAMLTTTINGPNSTKIYVQQHNSPMRSVITFEKSRKSSTAEKVQKEEKERSKSDYKRSRRPTSLYQNRESPKDSVNKTKVLGHAENNLKMKFPSTETIQLEEKCLVSENKNNINMCQKKNVFDPSALSLKAGSLIDVADSFDDNGPLNNIKHASYSMSPLQPSLSNDKILDKVLSYKNIFKATQNDLSYKKDDKNYCLNSSNKMHPTHEKSDGLNKQSENDLCPFPSLSDLSLHFTSIAAQKILKGVSINSIDTLVEVNMAAEKHSNDVGIRTDLGVV